MLFPRLRCLLLLVVASALAGPSATAATYELVIRGGRIVDGSGAPWYVADVGIDDGRIVKIGRIEASAGKREIDATGLIVAPGFIDMMGQTATPMLEDPAAALNLLTQGITTINAGEGDSAAPLDSEAGARSGWTTMAEYFQLLDMAGLPVNVAQTIGHTQVRRIVLSDVDRRPSDEELEKMRELVREAMQAGAIGVSTALIYPPAVFAQTQEIAELAKVAGNYGGRYFTHMRNEGDRLLEAIDEALDIGRTAGTPVHIFHLKAAGRQNWPKMALALARIKAARGQGQQVTADIYPYVNNGLDISSFIHPRHFGKGFEQLRGRLDEAELRGEIRQEMENTDGWENWYHHVGQDWDRVIVGHTGDKRYADLSGQSIAAIAKAKSEDPWETFFHLAASGAFVLPESMSQANVILAMREEFISFCTDVGPAAGQSIASHPRAFGAFPRLLSQYVRGSGAISLERAVAQASAVAANELMAYDRGRIAEGMQADVIVFDGDALQDRATFANPRDLSVGMQYVAVNGRLVFEDGKLTGQRPGRVLRGPGYDEKSAPYAVATGKLDPRMAEFDATMRKFVKEHAIPGAAIAVTNDKSLVFARGYGYADVAAHEQVTPLSLFRIASVSKPITAVAVLQLIEQKRLKLDDRVFDILDLKADIDTTEDFESRLRDVTIRHCLEHRGGWDRDKSFDAMFQAVRFAKQLNVPPPAGPPEVIRAMLGQKLDFDPGERYAYSNFGYCLLGRVIEKLTGQPYESYVQQHVLAPLGIHSMRIGHTHLADRHAGEVRYYQRGTGESVFAATLGKETPWQYGGWHLEAMDSHGGWIASAVDLARFAAAFDDPQHCPILSAESIELMHARPPGLAGHNEDKTPKDSFYSLGWFNRVDAKGRANHWHTGSLDGTATILIRRHDGKNFVALLNLRVSPRFNHLGREVDHVLHTAAAKVKDWPTEDGFSEYLGGKAGDVPAGGTAEAQASGEGSVSGENATPKP